jgi:hypothetical protein
VNVQAYFVDPDLVWMPAAAQAWNRWSRQARAVFPTAYDPVGFQHILWFVMSEAVGSAAWAMCGDRV